MGIGHKPVEELKDRGLQRQYVEYSKWAKRPDFPVAVRRCQELKQEMKRRGIEIPKVQ